MADEEMVPLARLSKVIEEREALRAELAQARKDAETARAASGDTEALRAKYEKLKADAAAQAKTWETERVYLEAGLTDRDARDVASLLYERLPAEGRPSLSDWLKAAKEDPAKAPKALAPYLAPPAAAEPPPRQAPATPRPAATTHAAGEAVTREAFEAAAIRARNEGTKEAREAYNAIRARYLEGPGR